MSYFLWVGKRRMLMGWLLSSTVSFKEDCEAAKGFIWGGLGRERKAYVGSLKKFVDKDSSLKRVMLIKCLVEIRNWVIEEARGAFRWGSVGQLGEAGVSLVLLHKTRLHIGQLVKDTSAKLKQASETDHHAEVSASKKIADAKLAKDFQAVLKEFQKAQRLAAERETAYTPFVPQSVLPSSYTASEIDVGPDKSPEQRALLVESRRQEVLLLDNEIVFNEAIIEEREQGIQEIQHQIGEVNEIFKDLAVLVHEQGVMIDDIGSNIDGAQAATAQAKSQLAKASKTQRSNSSLVILNSLILFLKKHNFTTGGTF
ncbi:Syntaxin-22 [Vitis vinifera]|uniref:Syntaxin-22 n=1 Tax=Vitis vinifera TaxID=29760 RepID=A0A438JZU7_VITVI|nr:Syntaxin-22 [Vitis vinifera]RVX14492.1 Syntaxin-22 [Vitis vinifera]